MLALLHNWDSFIYQFLAGGVLYAVGLVLPIMAGDVKWSRASDRRTIIWLIAGMVLFLSFFMVWQLFAIKRG